MSAEVDLLTYLRHTLGETPGWLHLGLGYEPYLSEHGTYRHRRWVPKAFWWSADNAPKIMTLILAEAQRADVYVCPYLMHQNWMIEGTKRRIGGAKGRSAACPSCMPTSAVYQSDRLAERLDESAPGKGLSLPTRVLQLGSTQSGRGWPSSQPKAQDATAAYLKAQGRQHG